MLDEMPIAGTLLKKTSQQYIWVTDTALQRKASYYGYLKKVFEVYGTLGSIIPVPNIH